MIGLIGGEFGLQIVSIHRTELQTMKWGNVGKIVLEMGIDLIIGEGEFLKFFPDVEIGENAGDDDIGFALPRAAGFFPRRYSSGRASPYIPLAD